MTKTILLDLDETLLGNKMDAFLPPYFDMLTETLADLLQGRDIRKLMSGAAKTMQANDDPTATNHAIFMQDFADRLGHPLDAVLTLLDKMYQEKYPSLQQVTTYRPEAAQLVKLLFLRGYQVIVATNPFYPATAIHQRLQWAGVADFPYLLVTHMENSCFAKPNPRYYEEIMAKVNGEPSATWMIGDDVRNDIKPANSLGIRTWWITDVPNVEVEADKQGSLQEVLTYFEAERL